MTTTTDTSRLNNALSLVRYLETERDIAASPEHKEAAERVLNRVLLYLLEAE